MKKSALTYIFNNKDKDDIICDYIYECYKKNINLDINEISKNCFLSTSNVTRYFKKNGFEGFKEFKYLLLNENEKIVENLDNIDFEKEYFFEPIIQTNIVNSDEQYEKINEYIINAKTIVIGSVGGNNPIALELQTRLLRLGFNAKFEFDPHLNYVNATNLKENDLLIILSYSGQTKEILKMFYKAKLNKTKIVTISGNNNCELFKEANIALMINSMDNYLKILSIKSRITMLYLIEKIILKLYLSNIKKYQNIQENNRY
ncbi:MurR/RpiR family transcriptional regulator [Spiroplasma endosymbiont of Amphibalanus improvisus]|uniref:MurR/RpiR family transcriptional regulator n=1 Tax=Spiroplasma endosymbiont of Amphibalanus improvisus TaxID=3066327 RepID=UPI00313CD8E4